MRLLLRLSAVSLTLGAVLLSSVTGERVAASERGVVVTSEKEAVPTCPEPTTPEPEPYIPPGKTFRAVVTAYTPYAESTGRTPGDPHFNRVAWWPRLGGAGTCAADTRYLPFGTALYIEGLGFCVVADRGGAIRGPSRLDYYMPGPEEVAVRAARAWGRREAWVEVLGRLP